MAEYVKVQCKILETRENAIKIEQTQRNGSKIIAWIPKSLCKRITNNNGLCKDEIELEDWIADNKLLNSI